MKIKNLIKSDFFINPENYGYFSHDDLDAIWQEIIKPAIYELEPDTTKIENTAIRKYIEFYRKRISEMN